MTMATTSFWKRQEFSLLSMKQYAVIQLIFFFIAVANISYAQTKPAKQQQQTLHLQLATFFLFVVNENRIDLDSALELVSKQTGISKFFVIGEKLQDVAGDLKGSEPGNQKEQLAQSHGLRHTRLLNLIGASYIFQPGSRHADLDSGFSFLKKAEQEALAANDENNLYQSLCVQGKYYFESGNTVMADSCYEKVIHQCIASGNKEYEAMAWYYRSTFAPFGMYPFDKRISYSKKALEIYLQRKEEEAAVNTLTNLAYLDYVVNPVKDCENANLQALLIEKKIHFPYTQYNEDLMAFVSAIQGNHPVQMQYGLQSVKTVETTGDSTGYAYFCARLGSLYAELDKINESIEWSNKAIDAFGKMGGNFSVYKATESLSSIVAKSASSVEAKKALQSIEAIEKKYPPTREIDKQYLYLALATCYHQLNEPVTSAKYFRMVEEIQQQTNAVVGNYNRSYFDIRLGYYAFNTGQYEKSRNYFLEVLSRSSPQNIGRISFANMHWMLFRIDSAERKYETAMQQLLRYSRLVDSIYNATESQQTAEIRIQYETEKKDNNIRLLTKQAELRDSQLKQERLTRNVFIGGAIMLVLLLALAYNRYRLKKRSNEQLQQQQRQINQQNQSLQLLIKEQQKFLEEKEWLVKEIHHRVKNNLQIVVSLLNTQAAHLEEGDALMAIKESRHRMQVISLLHQKLYQAETSSLIDMQVYIREVVTYLKESFKGINHLYFDLQMDSISLDISQAVPVGLILNEAITNCIKYAFPQNENGRITVCFKNEVLDTIGLAIQDNGVGINKNTAASGKTSLGMQLMETLAEQLDGTIRVEASGGTLIKVSFRKQGSERPVATAGNFKNLHHHA